MNIVRPDVVVGEEVEAVEEVEEEEVGGWVPAC